MRIRQIAARTILTVGLAVAAGMFGSCAVNQAGETDPAAMAIQIMPGTLPSQGDQVVAVRRVSESQYRHAIADAFGPGVEINARFEPDPRLDGLLAIGANEASISASGFQQYFAAGKSVAKQVLAKDRRAKTVTCTPVDATAADDTCASAFLTQYGKVLYRRALSEAELNSRVEVAGKAAIQLKDFYAGLELSLVSLLTSPEFLFRIERGFSEGNSGDLRLDDYSRASRISYLLWDAPPDPELLAAAEKGTLSTPAGLNTQIDRLVSSPRVQDGVRAFFADLLQLDLFETLNKDAAQYPKFNQAVAASAREQTLKVVVDLLAVKNGDYRDIFTTRDSFINRSLGAIYKVPFASDNEWASYTFDEASGQSGVLTQVAFTSLFSHPGRSSPTKRGAAINEIFLCQTIPQPPADVDLSAINDDGKSGATTVRQRLEAHRTNPMCTGCHTLSDPAGLALEQFDGIGQRRLQENGLPIDVAVEFFNIKVSGAQGLGIALREDARAPACLVKRVWAYGQGRAVQGRDLEQLKTATEAFVQDGHRVPALLARIAASEAFFTAPRPQASAETR